VDMSDLNRLVQLRGLTLMKVDVIVQPALGTRLENVGSSLWRRTCWTAFQSCDNAWLDNWARRQQHVQVIFWLEGELEMTCKNENGIQNFGRNSEAYCSLDVGFVLFICTSLGLLLFILVGLLHQLAGDYLLAFCYIARADGASLPVSVCLHSRDFQLGKDIVDNSTDSLYGSRHTLCLVSRHYLRSNWCSLELTSPPRHMSAHHRLARLVKTRTYLDWPQDPGPGSAASLLGPPVD
uniref:TIR domain-containing protein n=1 Tax=Hucho hucho TaxID=62062 RepID=A0A4W5LUX6_9TELE